MNYITESKSVVAVETCSFGQFRRRDGMDLVTESWSEMMVEAVDKATSAGGSLSRYKSYLSFSPSLIPFSLLEIKP